MFLRLELVLLASWFGSSNVERVPFYRCWGGHVSTKLGEEIWSNVPSWYKIAGM